MTMADATSSAAHIRQSITKTDGPSHTTLVTGVDEPTAPSAPQIKTRIRMDLCARKMKCVVLLLAQK